MQDEKQTPLHKWQPDTVIRVAGDSMDVGDVPLGIDPSRHPRPAVVPMYCPQGQAFPSGVIPQQALAWQAGGDHHQPQALVWQAGGHVYQAGSVPQVPHHPWQAGSAPNHPWQAGSALQGRPLPVVVPQTYAWVADETSSASPAQWSRKPVRGKRATSSWANKKRRRCAFCFANGEEDFWHVFKDEKNNVLCPVLSAYICRLCGATGHLAHTLKYCPKNKITKGDPVATGFPPGLMPSHIKIEDII